jgi:hypothetical protein
MLFRRITFKNPTFLTYESVTITVRNRVWLFLSVKRQTNKVNLFWLRGAIYSLRHRSLKITMFSARPVQKCTLSDPRRALVNGRFLSPRIFLVQMTF